MLAAHPWLLGGSILTLFASTNAFYLPGAAPHDYKKGEQVKLFVNALTPMLPGTDNAKLVRAPFRNFMLLSLTLYFPYKEISHKLYVSP